MKKKVPETSHEALEEKSTNSKNSDINKILMAYKQIGQGNYDDVAKFLQLSDANVVSRRLSEMRGMGLLEFVVDEKGNKVKSITQRNRKAFVHQIKGSNQPKTEKKIVPHSTSADSELDKQPRTKIWEQTELL